MKLDLFLFSVDEALIGSAIDGGVAGIIVDWESIGKSERQRGYDTQINSDTLADLQRVRRATTAPLLCRLNEPGPSMLREIDDAIGAGANELLLPMIRRPESVDAALAHAAGRADIGILIETEEALACAHELGTLPLSRVYVGLMDLSICRRSTNLFAPLIDGTLERIRPHFGMPFGFGGLTLPDRGSPIPSRLLLAEMARLDCAFSFLRRSFLRDTEGRNLDRAVAAIDRAAELAFSRSEIERSRDAEALKCAVAEAFP